MITLHNLIETLQAYARDAQDIYRRKVAEQGHSASGDLIASVVTNVSTDSGEYSVTMDLAKYWKFLEGGSKGRESSYPGALYAAHWPPVDALLRWIQVKPVIPRPAANGKLPTQKQLAYLIGRKIATKGTEPHPMLAETLEELNERYSERIADALALDVRQMLEEGLHH